MAERTRVLVTYASKMGSTQEIAEAIGRELENFGMQVTVAPCAENVSPEGIRRGDHRQCDLHPALGQDSDQVPQTARTQPRPPQDMAVS